MEKRLSLVFITNRPEEASFAKRRNNGPLPATESIDKSVSSEDYDVSISQFVGGGRVASIRNVTAQAAKVQHKRDIEPQTVALDEEEMQLHPPDHHVEVGLPTPCKQSFSANYQPHPRSNE
jgi:hypothetical protein